MVEQETRAGRGVMHSYAGVWDDIGRPETNEEWRKSLLFPDTYQVERVECNGGEWNISVVSECIPVGDAHISQIDITPVYRKTDRGEVELVEIRLMQWDGERWTHITQKEV